MFRKKCLICYSINLKEIIDLGIHPFADTFISKKNLNQSEKVYPLIVQLCSKCGNIQLKCETSPEDRYQENEYSYTSSNSEYSKSYWKKYSKEVLNLFPNKSKLKILEIGSNDGFLLGELKKFGHAVFGVDASDKMKKIASKKNINTMLAIFSKKNSKKILKKKGRFEIIIANNVFNHADNPQDFFQGVNKLLTKKGVFIFESPYWFNSIKSGKFDQIYHEHVIYFTARSINKLVEMNNLFVKDVKVTEYHGGSIRFIVSRKKNEEGLIKINNLINKENKLGLYNIFFYKKFMKNLKQRKNKFMKKIYTSLIKSEPLICVGAAAKANTFLNFYGLDNKIVRYVTDASKNKIGKYTPLTRIPIMPDMIIKKFKKPNVIFTAWNVSDNLKKIIFKINPTFTEQNPYDN